MKEFDVDIKSVNNIKQFCKIANSCKRDVTAQAGRYIVDAKSIMGLFSLDLSGKVRITYDENIDTRFKEQVLALGIIKD